MALLSDKLRDRSRELRHQQTEVERMLWYYLKARRVNGWRFRRQHPIPPYIVDFACLEAKLIVEADGGQHAESRHDRRRDEFLGATGWRVLRFWNSQILTNVSGVVQMISDELGPHPTLPHATRGGGINC